MDENFEQTLRDRLELLHSLSPGTVANILHLELVSYDPQTSSCWLRARTMEWMRNGGGTLHGGLGATILDHAMGGLLYCVKDGDNICPTIEMQASYHRPLTPGKDVLVKVRVVSKTRRLAHMAAEVYQADAPEKLCLSGTSVYFLA